MNTAGIDISKIPFYGLGSGKFPPFIPPVNVIQIEKEITDHENNNSDTSR